MRTNVIEEIPFHIQGIEESTILKYFQAFNKGNFTAISTLFTDDSVLYFPFEEPIVGNEAIATYLNSKAKGMKLYPLKGNVEEIPDGYRKIRVIGKAKTPLFGVHVSWTFILTPNQHILGIRINLLASPQELLKLQQIAKRDNCQSLPVNN